MGYQRWRCGEIDAGRLRSKGVVTMLCRVTRSTLQVHLFGGAGAGHVQAIMTEIGPPTPAAFQECLKIVRTVVVPGQRVACVAQAALPPLLVVVHHAVRV